MIENEFVLKGGSVEADYTIDADRSSCPCPHRPGLVSLSRSARSDPRSHTNEERKMKRRPIINNVGQLVTAFFFVTVGGTAVWARGASPVVVAGYGPGVAGQVLEGPTTPVCRPNIPCTRPFANATIHVQDSATQNPVGTAVTNTRGNFLVSVPQGTYIVRVQTGPLPRCPEVSAAVGPTNFTLVHISCDTGIR
jgi:hypothetical protein